MVEFRIARHTRKPVEVIEIWVDGEFRATLYPHGPDGVRLISGYFAGEPVKEVDGPPAAWKFRFSPQKVTQN